MYLSIIIKSNARARDLEIVCFIKGLTYLEVMFMENTVTAEEPTSPLFCLLMLLKNAVVCQPGPLLQHHPHLPGCGAWVSPVTLPPCPC